MNADAGAVGSLFSGTGALDMAVTRVLGGSVAWHAEHEPASEKHPRPTQAAARLLAHRYAGTPNLGDIALIDWDEVPRVDVLTGGFPCQDVSTAGRRLGLRPGTRSGLWSWFAYAVAQLRPQLVVIENVGGLLSADAVCDLEPCPWCLGDGRGRYLRALGAVLGDLANLGYDSQWRGVRAADVGAPHRRFRVFIAAWPSAPDPVGGGCVGGPALAEPTGRPRRRATTAGRREGPAAAAESLGRGEGWPEPARLVGGPDAAVGRARLAADADGGGLGPDERDDVAREPHAGGRASAEPDGDGRAGRPEPDLGPETREPTPRRGDAPRRLLDWGAYEPAIRRWELILGRPAPAPTQTGALGGQQLSPLFVEWLMGLPKGWVTDVPGLTRNEMLRLLGNGVVPQQAEAALRLLLGDMTEQEAA